MIKKLTQAFEEQNLLLKELINDDGDLAAIQDTDLKIQNIIESIRKLHVMTNEDISLQLKFFVNIAAPSNTNKGDNDYTSILLQLIDRYHGSEKKYTNKPVSRLLKQG